MPRTKEPATAVVGRRVEPPRSPLMDRTRIVGRLARPDEAATVRGLLEAQRPNQVVGERPLVSIVALLAGEVVGAASAWPGATPRTAYAAVGVDGRWRDLGVAVWLGRRLAHELRELGVRTIVHPASVRDVGGAATATTRT